MWWDRYGLRTVSSRLPMTTLGRSASVYISPVTKSRMAETTAPKRGDVTPWTSKSSTQSKQRLPKPTKG